MADYISREAASDLLAMALIDEWEPEYAQDRLSEIPAADVVEVVRCKDCIHNNSNDPICPIPWVKRMINSFCSFGERRDDK